MDIHFHVEGVLGVLGCEYDADECRLFIDSSKSNLKCIVLHPCQLVFLSSRKKLVKITKLC